MDKQINGDDNYRDASFSYLRSEQSLTQKSSTSTRTSFGLERKKSDHEGEISVFGAERYFNMALEDHHHGHDHQRIVDSRSSAGKKQGGDDHHDLIISRPRTPSACSEVSWTSKSTALLLKANSSSIIRNPSRKYHSSNNGKKKIISGSKTFFATLGCTGTCADKKSVCVDHGDQDKQDNHDHVAVRNSKQVEQDPYATLSQEPNRPHHDDRLRYEARSTKRSEEHFAFPILSGTVEANKTIVKTDEKQEQVSNTHSNGTKVAADEPPRMSLEVFGSQTTLKSTNVLDEVAINLERKLSVLTWDAIPAKPYSNKVSLKTNKPGNGRSAATHDDIDSDASSDLFEIENITSGTRCSTPNHNFCGRGDYEPSEASIEWSVVTASAVADLSSDYDEKKLAANGRVPSQKAAARRRPNNGILGCRSQKSASVAETAHIRSSGNKETAAISSKE